MEVLMAFCDSVFRVFVGGQRAQCLLEGSVHSALNVVLAWRSGRALPLAPGPRRLSDNSLGGRGAASIAAALGGSAPISTLLLDHNRIDLYGGKALGNALSSNRTLRVLTCVPHPLSAPCVRGVHAWTRAVCAFGARPLA